MGLPGYVFCHPALLGFPFANDFPGRKTEILFQQDFWLWLHLRNANSFHSQYRDDHWFDAGYRHSATVFLLWWIIPLDLHHVPVYLSQVGCKQARITALMHSRHGW